MTDVGTPSGPPGSRRTHSAISCAYARSSRSKRSAREIATARSRISSARAGKCAYTPGAWAASHSRSISSGDTMIGPNTRRSLRRRPAASMCRAASWSGSPWAVRSKRASRSASAASGSSEVSTIQPCAARASWVRCAAAPQLTRSECPSGSATPKLARTVGAQGEDALVQLPAPRLGVVQRGRTARERHHGRGGGTVQGGDGDDGHQGAPTGACSPQRRPGHRPRHQYADRANGRCSRR